MTCKPSEKLSSPPKTPNTQGREAEGNSTDVLPAAGALEPMGQIKRIFF